MNKELKLLSAEMRTLASKESSAISKANLYAGRARHYAEEYGRLAKLFRWQVKATEGVKVIAVHDYCRDCLRTMMESKQTDYPILDYWGKTEDNDFETKICKACGRLKDTVEIVEYVKC